MASKRLWSHDELIIAMNLYCKLPFGQFHKRNPIIIEVAQKLGRTPSSLAARTHDVAFERGLITLDENYRLMIITYLEKFLPEETLELNFFAYRGKQINLPDKFLPNPDFLGHHRQEIFRE